MLALRQFVLQ
ncbi:hypothetical protein YPPY94_2736, partial [Yersinia pestis PY-94]